MSSSLSQQAEQIIEIDELENFKSALQSRDRWLYVYRTLDVCSHLLSGATTILSFLSGIIVHPVLAIIAGCTSTAMLVCNAYSSYSRQEYINQCKVVEQYTQQFKISDQEVNEANDDNNSVQATAPSTTAPQTPQITTPTPTPASQTAIITQH